jgi:uncharacterized protein (TIGR02099 family)
MVKKSFLWMYRFTLTAIWVMIFVMSLTILGLRYFVLPEISHYQNDIAQAVSKQLGQHVNIGSIEASWQGLNPRIRLKQVDIYDQENRIALSLEKVDSTLSWLSIPLFEPRLASLIVYRPELNIRREADGTVYIAGISLSGPTQLEFPNWLLRQTEIAIVDAEVIWNDAYRKAPEVKLSKLNLKVENPTWDRLRGRHRFALKATPSAISQQAIDIRGNLFGHDFGKLDEWRGRFYAEVRQSNFAELKRWMDFPFELQSGEGDARVWVSFDELKIERITGDVNLSNLTTQIPYQNQPASTFNHLAGRIQWEKQETGQLISAQNIQVITPENLNIKNGNFSLQQSQKDNQPYYQGNISLEEFQLESTNKLLPYLPLPEKVSEQFKVIQPVGKLSQLSLSWKGAGNALNEYALKSNFSDFGVDPIEAYDIPGFQHLSGNVNLTQNNGTLQFNSDRVVLYPKQVLRYGVPVDYIRGKVVWRSERDKINVHLNKLAFSTPHAVGEVNGYVEYDDANGLYLDLTGGVTKGDARFTKLYLPTVLSKDTLDWIDTSILQGQVEDVGVIIKGKAKDFPFVDNKKGMFRITGKASNVLLDYVTGWPMITVNKMNLLFEGKRMELFVHDGQVLNNKILNTKVSIPDLLVDNTMLDIKGEVNGNVNDQLNFINTSPLVEWSGGFSHGVKGSGNGKLNLDLSIALYNEQAVHFKGKYSFINGGLIDDGMPELNQINGDVVFNDNGLNAPNLHMNVFDSPAIVSIATDKAKTLQINAKGKITDSGIRKSLGLAIPSSVTGSTEWQAHASISDKKTEFNVRSNLQGLSLQLPYPLTKQPNESLAFSLDRKTASNNQDLIQFTLGSAVSGKFLHSTQNGVSKIERGEIGVNVGAEIPNQNIVNLRVLMNHLDMDEWMTQFEKAGGSSQGMSLPINHIDLSADTFEIFDKRFNNLKMSTQINNNVWMISLKSDEVTGSMRWVDQGAGRLLANLTQLTLPQDAPDKKAKDKTIKQLDLRYPDLEINADNFDIGKKKFGRLELSAKEQNGNWIIQKLMLKNPDGVITATGQWNNWKTQQNTLMNFNWQISDIGKTFKRLNFAEMIKGGTAQLNGQLRWAGSPHEFDFPNLSGNLQLLANKGQILKIEPGVGRLFSVLSLQNLPRRLTLDFKDLFSSGFVFDKISADIAVNRGVMRSENFAMEGPTAMVEIKGETDLDKETQHFYVKVKPYITDTLSLAAFAGGPAVGAAAYIAQKVLKNPLDKIAESEYEIIGTWSNPEEREVKSATPAGNLFK